MICIDNPKKPWNVLTDDKELLAGLLETYNEACKERDWALCRLLQDQIELLLKGKNGGGIKIESGLNLKPTLM